MTNLQELTRRTILKGVAGTLGIAAAGAASAHPGAGDHGNEHEHPPVDNAGTTQVGYHGLGGEAADYHYGGISELKVQGDLGVVGVLSSKDPTYDRGVAILDVSDYTRAEDTADLQTAEPDLLSFVPNENNAVSVMDVKLSSDGNYAFLSKQPIAVRFMDQEARTDQENLGNSPEAGSLQAVDLSDPENPGIVGRWDGWGFGPHNSDHLRIGGTDYVFAVKGPIGSNAGVYVVRFDRSTGNMTLVNYWLDGDNYGAGEVGDPTKGQIGTAGYDYYVHDIAVERDPQTGWPIAYVANLNDGAYVLDVSDPREMQTLGHFDMYRSHEIWPITATCPDGPKRLFVTGQENPSSQWSDGFGSYGDNIDGDTGWLYLVDAGELDPGNQDEPVDLGAAPEHENFDDDPPLARWELSDDAEFENYTLSLHNVDPFEVEIDGQPRQFVAAGHYHAGVRMLEFSEALGWSVRGGDAKYIDCGIREVDGSPSSNGDDGLGEVAYFRSHEEDVPDDAKMTGLTEATPDFWCAVQQNGVIFTSGINTGVYTFTVEPDRGKPEDDFCRAPVAPDIPVGTDLPITVEVTRTEGADAFTSGQSARYELDVSHDADEPVMVFDRVPSEWTVDGDAGDVRGTWDVGDGTLVDLGPVESDDSVVYYVKVDGETGTGTVGEVLYKTDERAFHSVAGTVDSNLVVGASTDF